MSVYPHDHPAPADLPSRHDHSHPGSALYRRWRHRFLVAQAAFFLNHVLMLAGPVGILQSGAAGPGGLSRRDGGLSVAGLVALGVCELAAMPLLHAAQSSPAAGLLGAGYGLASLLIGTGLVLLGAAVARTGGWAGWRRWIVLACGAGIFLVAVPAITGPFLAGRLGLVGWVGLFVVLGVALARPITATPARPVPATVH
jgi:hypothetical protein